jgi:hypothetical protein
MHAKDGRVFVKRSDLFLADSSANQKRAHPWLGKDQPASTTKCLRY